MPLDAVQYARSAQTSSASPVPFSYSCRENALLCCNRNFPVTLTLVLKGCFTTSRACCSRRNVCSHTSETKHEYCGVTYNIVHDLILLPIPFKIKGDQKLWLSNHHQVITRNSLKLGSLRFRKRRSEIEQSATDVNSPIPLYHL
jgi:hypothetical protein